MTGPMTSIPVYVYAGMNDMLSSVPAAELTARRIASELFDRGMIIMPTSQVDNMMSNQAGLLTELGVALSMLVEMMGKLGAPDSVLLLAHLRIRQIQESLDTIDEMSKE